MLGIGINLWAPGAGGESAPPGTTVSAVFPEFGADAEAVRVAPATVASSFPEFTASVAAELVVGGGDTDPPGFTWAVATDGTYTEGTADEDCDQTSTPAAGDFSQTGTHATIASVAWQSATVIRLTYTSGSRVTDFETVTTSYTPGVNPLRDLALNEAGPVVGAATANASEFLQGALGLLSVQRASSYTLSGSDVTHLVDEVSGASLPTSGAPQYAATGLNGRPSLDLDGTDDFLTTTSLAALRAALLGQAAHHVFMIAQVDNEDPAAAYSFVAVGNPGSANGRRAKLVSSVGAGAHRDSNTNNTGTTLNRDGVDGNPDTSPHVYEWFGDTATNFRRDGGALDINAAAWAPTGTTTATNLSFFARPGAAGHESFLDGDFAWLVAFGSVLTTGTNSPENIRAYCYFLSGLTGL